MRLKTVVRLGVFVSIALFALAIGYYTFVRLEANDRSRNTDLFAWVPSDCESVMETQNLYVLLNDLSTLNYSDELELLRSRELYHFLLNILSDYINHKAHGLSNEMSRMLVSYHGPSDSREQVVYLGMGATDEEVLTDMLREYAPVDFHPKREIYRDKELMIFPLGTEEFLVAYSEENSLVVSLQKHLIEKVVDARLDGTSLANEPVFEKILQQKKSSHSLTLYARTSAIPFLQMEEDCWSEYAFYMNSDVLYLTGDTYVPDSYNLSSHSLFTELTPCQSDSLFLTLQKDSLQRFVDLASEQDALERNLFEQGIANLSKEADFSMLVDMRYVATHPEQFADIFPPFVLNHSRLFQPFVVSVQYSRMGDQLSHFWIFTYQN